MLRDPTKYLRVTFIGQISKISIQGRFNYDIFFSGNISLLQIGNQKSVIWSAQFGRILKNNKSNSNNNMQLDP